MPHPIYLAGELFSAKHLLGNATLAARISTTSSNRYHCLLPHDIPQPSSTPHAIRDNDLLALLSCDAAVFNYDGLELDSGTVIEYLFAKFADIPAVLLRTDFRHAGDARDGDPWNLMNSFHPRTETIWLNSLEIYQTALKNSHSSSAAADSLLDQIAKQTTAALDRVLTLPPVLPRHLSPAVYEWLALMPAFANPAAARDQLLTLHREKTAKSLL